MGCLCYLPSSTWSSSSNRCALRRPGSPLSPHVHWFSVLHSSRKKDVLIIQTVSWYFNHVQVDILPNYFCVRALSLILCFFCCLFGAAWFALVLLFNKKTKHLPSRKKTKPKGRPSFAHDISDICFRIWILYGQLSTPYKFGTETIKL